MREFNINQNNQPRQEKGIHVELLNDITLQVKTDYGRIRIPHKLNANNILTRYILYAYNASMEILLKEV